MRLTSITQRYTQILYLHSKTMEVNYISVVQRKNTFKKNTPAIMQTYFYYYFQTCENQINVDSVTW